MGLLKEAREPVPGLANRPETGLRAPFFSRASYGFIVFSLKVTGIWEHGVRNETHLGKCQTRVLGCLG